MTLEERLAEIEKLCEAATPEPWDTYGRYGEHVRTEVGYSEFRVYKIKHRGDAEFIAESRELVPQLVKALRYAINKHGLYSNYDELERTKEVIQQILNGKGE